MEIVQINIDEEHHELNEMMDPSLYEFVKLDSIVSFKSCVRKRSAKELLTPAGNSLLHVAVSYGSDKITSYLAEEFPSLITTQNSQEDTILHLAAREGKYSDIIKSLVESNPCLMRKTNTKGNTPLHDAVIKGNRDLAIFLASKDPEVAYYNNKNGRSPLYLAVEKGKKNGILDDLLKLGASIPIKREDGDALPKGKSPVHAAIERRDKGDHIVSEGVQFLLNKFLNGAYERNSEGNYPIHIACKNDSVDVVNEFLKSTPFPKEFLNYKGKNILHVAAENGKDRVVRYILRQKETLVLSLLNEMDEDGNTPLHLATHRGQSVAAFVLVRDKRVDNSIVNNENLTPYDIAEQQSKIAVEQYEKTDEMLAEDRKLFYSKNSNPAKEKEVESKKQGKPSPKEYKLLDYYGAMTTSSILYFHACPTKFIYEHFTSTDQCKTPRKQETKSRIQNLLVVAVLVAGVTFSGAIQMPQLRSKNNSGEHTREFNSTATASRNNTAFDSPTGSSLLDGYLCLDVWALNTSVVAAIILLWTNLNDVKFAPFAS
uniref:PGG domain-containing protein n=1 Tax=Salix viminalis TaxID=40686 RepID=A0A6N2M043_SALVM